MSSGKPKSYYNLVKPGIIYGNLLTATGGFLYGSILRINSATLFWLLVGTALVIASGCVLNNYFDRDIDKLMKRTKKRASVTGSVSGRSLIIFGVILLIFGLVVLYLFTNTLTTLLGLIGFVSYTFIYTFAKRKTVHATLIGTLPGAIPPVAGYAAATNHFDVSAWILLAILIFWQMTHFYAIAIYRLDEYKKAGIPIMPAVYGIWATKVQMLVYGCGYLLAVVSLAKFSYAGLFYLAVMAPLATWWLAVIAGGLFSDEDKLWARKVFFLSLIMLPALTFTLALNAYTP